MSGVLSPYRRHQRSCRFYTQGRRQYRCACPVWVQGVLNGRSVRQSLDTRNWNAALRRMGDLENPSVPLRTLRLDAAIQSFLAATKDLAESTRYKYGKGLRFFQAFCEQLHLTTLPQIASEDIERYRNDRAIGAITWSKELEMLRQFFGYCLRKHWLSENPARLVKMPRNLRPADEIRPYTPAELQAVLLAAPQIGKHPYERRRGRAVVLLLRHTGLRITDVATLRRDRVLPDGRLLLRTQKTGGQVFLPLPGEVLEALSELPRPIHADPWCPYFFWNGISKTAVVKGIAERTLRAVFRKAGVVGYAHRFRHTLATEILSRGGSMQDVADVLGISVKVAEKHYSKWNLARQERIDRVMRQVWAGDATGTRVN